MTGWASNRVVALGLVPQRQRVVPSLTVLENLNVAARAPGEEIKSRDLGLGGAAS
ncbi:MAG TPA: hypothetical protein VLG10_03555 [Methylomirabilota bacterium]|nr:hypothetical protein [Methylomirabilota bacterium]